MKPTRDNQRASIRLYKYDLHRLLDLPEGMAIDHIGTQFDPHCFVIGVKAPWLPSVPDHESAPLLEGSWDRTVHVDKDGTTWVRWGWDPEMPTVDEQHPMLVVGGIIDPIEALEIRRR